VCAQQHFKQGHSIECRFHLKDSGSLMWDSLKQNKDARKRLFETAQMSAYALSIKPNEALSTEVHPDATQFFLVVRGSGTCTIDGNQDNIQKHSMFYVPAGKKHSVQASAEGLKLLTLYAPAEHHTEK
jgi:mannose-6-phosphate isomerase-like protein (cupin superfamily)